MARARTVAEVIAGEAVSGTPEQRIADMRAIASVVANRAALLGITPEQVVANSREFNAYNRSLPPGVGQAIIDMAQEQIDYVAENGPVNNATFYATPNAAGNLPNGLTYESETAGHQFFSDPQNRAIGTSEGFISPNQFAFAQNPANVPAPSLTGQSINGWSEMAAAPPVEALQPSPGWGLNQDVAPALTPTIESWSQMAAADPMTAPMGSVTASGIFAGTNPMEASANVQGLPEAATVASRMGIAEPGFDQSRFDGGTVSTATDFDQARFADPALTAFDQSRMPGLIDPATNVQSFMGVPQQPADIASLASGYEAQRGPTSGIFSAEMQAMQGHTFNEAQKAEAARQAALSQTPSLATAYADEAATAPAVAAIEKQMSVPASGIFAANAPLSAQATVPSIPGTMTPQQIAGYQEAAAGLVQGGMLNIGQQPETNLSGELPTNLDVLGTTTEAAPDLETVEVPDQPTISKTQTDIPGPATTEIAPAKTTTQQVTAAKTEPAKRGFWDSLVSPQTAIGATVGGLALGPVGGFLGAALGQQVAANPGMFANEPMQINNIGSGYDAVTSIWGGGMPAGTQATASDGQQVTSMGNGYTAITGKSGVVTVFDPSGKAMSYFGSGLGQDQDESTSTSTNSGGIFGGLFG